jgi:HSP20 family protein
MALLQQSKDLEEQFQAMVDRMFGEFPRFADIPRWTTLTAPPALDLYETEGKYTVEIAVPGYDPKEINVEVSGNALTVSGQHVETTEKKEAKYHRKEMRRGSFSRTVTLPQDIDSETVEADIQKGVLKIELSPIKPIAAKKVAIKGTAS